MLTKEEKDVIILAATHLGKQHLNNAKIGQHLGISVTRVKRLIHRACVKLGADNRIEAIALAIRRGEIRLDELYTLDETVEFLNSLDPDVLIRIARIMREGLEYGHLPEDDDQFILTDRRQDTLLTKSELDVLILVGRGLKNVEIADKLCISIYAVNTFLYRAYSKLGVCKRADAVVLALKRGEMSICDMYSIKELLTFFAPLGAEYLEEMAQLLSQRLEKEPVPTGI